MKVLILHQHFKVPDQGGAIRSYYLATALRQKGIDTVVITSHNGRQKQEVVDNVVVHYLDVPYDNRFQFGKRISAFLTFALKAVHTARLHRDADLIYAISTPLTTGLAARAIKMLYSIPYIFEVGDLWPDAPVAMGFIKHPILKHILYRMERKIYKDASSVVALSEPIRTAIVRKVPGKTVHVIPNMSDTEYFQPEERRSVIEEELKLRGKLVVSYIGALGIANGLNYLLECARECQTQMLPVHFIVCGDGAMLPELQNYARKMQITNSTFVPFQTRHGVKEILSVTDVNVVCYLPIKILETGSPNKYFDGLAAGKATLANFSGWLREEIEREGCGVFVDPGDVGDFIQKIGRLSTDQDLLRTYKQAARRLAEKRYSRRMLSETFVNVCLSATELPEGGSRPHDANQNIET